MRKTGNRGYILLGWVVMVCHIVLVLQQLQWNKKIKNNKVTNLTWTLQVNNGEYVLISQS